MRTQSLTAFAVVIIVIAAAGVGATLVSQSNKDGGDGKGIVTFQLASGDYLNYSHSCPVCSEEDGFWNYTVGQVFLTNGDPVINLRINMSYPVYDGNWTFLGWKTKTILLVCDYDDWPAPFGTSMHIGNWTNDSLPGWLGECQGGAEPLPYTILGIEHCEYWRYTPFANWTFTTYYPIALDVWVYHGVPIRLTSSYIHPGDFYLVDTNIAQITG